MATVTAAARPLTIAPMGGDDDPAIHADGRWTTHGRLREMIHARSRRLGTDRRVVPVRVRNDLDSVVEYLAALAAGFPALLVPADDDPMARDLSERFCGGPTPHPDLALLLSTSGSTGSPKLVRLSYQNLRANAEAIAGYLDISAEDRAMLTLPLHYSYGLSVLHSHLVAGAAVVLSPTSVVDPCCWQTARDAGVTNLAGVPHTFDLLDRIDFAAEAPPTLRLVTAAGGRMAPSAVRRWAELGEHRGFDFVVMYGATEATARMAWLPPQLARSRPGSIGVPIPGGSLRLELRGQAGQVDDDGTTCDAGDADEHGQVGELVYSGPNVMMGYAHDAADLTRGSELCELRTGDLARQCDDGLWEIVGRANRFVKPFGLRVDLDHLEDALGTAGIPAVCAGTDERLAIAVSHGTLVQAAADLVTERTGLPRTAVLVAHLPEVPRRANGKVDTAAVTAAVAQATAPSDTDAADLDTGPDRETGAAASADTVTALLARHMPGREVRPDDTFVSLGGDSLTYIEVSMDLEAALGHLPANWHLMSVADLAAARDGGATSRLARMEVGAVLRAVGIVLVLGRHIGLFAAAGGAHVLMALSGHNFSRFPLTAMGADGRPGRLWRTTARVAVPSAVWIGLVVALGGGYSVWNVVFANSITGPDSWGDTWRYWYVEALVHILALAALAFSVPAVRRIAARAPFVMPMTLAAGSLVIRFGVIEVGAPQRQLNLAAGVAWLFLLGWSAHRASGFLQRLLVSALVLAAVPGFFDDPVRELAVAAALMAVIWVREVPVPRRLSPIVATIASASLWIYLVHWQVYPPLEGHLHPALLVGLCLVVGVLAWRLWELGSARAVAAVGQLRRRRTRNEPVAETSSKRPEAIAGR